MTFAVVDIVTGASQGIGRAIAECIAFHRCLHPPERYSLVMVGRNMDRGTQAARDLSTSTGLDVVFEPCDVSDYQDVQSLQHRISQTHNDFTVGVLVNDAAECPKKQQFVARPQTQPDGTLSTVQLDKQFATNVLGYHFMLKAFQSHFGLGEQPTRVVNVASNWAGSLDLNDLSFQRRTYDNDDAYRQSKQCNRMLSKTWAEKLCGTAIVNSCHPGDPCTTLSKALGYNMYASPPSRQMVERSTPIPFLCWDVETTGGWFQGTGTSPMRCQFAGMTKESERLYNICESFCDQGGY